MYFLQQNETKDVNRKTVTRNVSSNDKIPRIFAPSGNDLYSIGKKLKKESTPVHLIMMLFKIATMSENQEYQLIV